MVTLDKADTPRPVPKGLAAAKTVTNGGAKTRLVTSIFFMAFLIALAFTPISDSLKQEFAEWGFYGSIGYMTAKTLQNLISKEK